MHIPKLTDAKAGLALLLLLSTSALADQTDPRLDNLFATLAETRDAEELTQTENRIWVIWYQHADENAQAMLVAGERLMNAGYYADALRVLTALIEQQPDFAEAWNRRATLHYVIGNPTQSISDIEETLALEPRHFGALSGLGLVYLQRNNLLKARESFEKLLEVHPRSPAGRQNLERVLEALRTRFI